MLAAPKSNLVSSRLRSAVLGLVALAALAITGCSNALGIDQPVLEQPDAAVHPGPQLPDASDAAPTCPAAPAGCTAFRCAATTSCYYACSGRTNWIAAQSYCGQMSSSTTANTTPTTAMKATLASIEGPLEQDCIATATQPTASDPVWTGLYQLDSAAEPDQGWTWVDGDADAWRNWANFEPYDWAGDRDCSDMVANGDWKADVCSYNRRFVCKVAPH